jgi:hypothetical protein
MQDHYFQMAEHYSALAEAEERLAAPWGGAAALGGIFEIVAADEAGGGRAKKETHLCGGTSMIRHGLPRRKRSRPFRSDADPISIRRNRPHRSHLQDRRRLGARDAHPMHDDGKLAGERHLGFLDAGPLVGDPHRPALESGATLDRPDDDVALFVEILASHPGKRVRTATPTWLALLVGKSRIGFNPIRAGSGKPRLRGGGSGGVGLNGTSCTTSSRSR